VVHASSPYFVTSDDEDLFTTKEDACPSACCIFVNIRRWMTHARLPGDHGREAEEGQNAAELQGRREEDRGQKLE
jgi:hypothetical protein